MSRNNVTGDQDDHSHDDASQESDDHDDHDGEDEDEDDNDVGKNFKPSTTTPSSPGFPMPSSSDVICGRGKATSSHPGNRRLRDLVTQKKDDYTRAVRRDEKTAITSDIVKQIRDSGSHFLLFDHTTKLWHDVGDEYAKEKVSHSLRSRPPQRRTRHRATKKMVVRKAEHSPAIDRIVEKLLNDQQSMLQAMIEGEVNMALGNGGREADDDAVSARGEVTSSACGQQ